MPKEPLALIDWADERELEALAADEEPAAAESAMSTYMPSSTRGSGFLTAAKDERCEGGSSSARLDEAAEVIDTIMKSPSSSSASMRVVVKLPLLPLLTAYRLLLWVPLKLVRLEGLAAAVALRGLLKEEE